MHNVSFPKGAPRITIRNLCLDLELISSIYCSNSATFHISSSQQTAFGTKVKASFGIDSQQEYFKGALLYKLRRRYLL
jgi:hypothetical protein